MRACHNTIPIVILGQTSVGKSTFLNALLGARVSHTSIQRTTMNAQFYTEDSSVTILRVNELYEKNAETLSDTPANSNHHHHHIPKLDALWAILPLCLVDTPGLDDGESSVQYRTYANDVLGPIARVYILMVDIHEAFNTSSSRDTLQLICDIAKRHSTLPYKLLVVVNKCDGMKWNRQPLATDFAMEDHERAEMYTQIEKVVKETTDACANLNYKIVPVSLANASVYRQLKRHPTLDLPQHDLDRIGREELGKRVWQRKTDTEKHEWFKTAFQPDDYVERMHETGFTHLCTTLNEWLDKDSISKWVVHDALYALEDDTKDYPIREILGADEESWLVKMCRQIDECVVLLHEHFAGSSIINTYTEGVEKMFDKRCGYGGTASNHALRLLADVLTVFDERCSCCQLSNHTRALLSSAKNHLIEKCTRHFESEVGRCFGPSIRPQLLPVCHWICKWKGAPTCSAILKAVTFDVSHALNDHNAFSKLVMQLHRLGIDTPLLLAWIQDYLLNYNGGDTPNTYVTRMQVYLQTFCRHRMQSSPFLQ